MSESQVPLLARQPILDKDQTIVGYELLSRPVPAATLEWQQSHGDTATSEVITGAFSDLGIEEVTGGLPAYINFTQYWLENPPALGNNLIVAELLEHLDVSNQQLQHVNKLRQMNFKVALDDYTGAPISDDMLDLIDIIKVDLMALTDINELTAMIQRYQRPGLKWLAEKVETREEFEFCKQAGCELFQGFFFARPHVMYGKKLPDNKISVLKLLKVLNNPEAEVDDITLVIQADPQLSFKLLQIVNSASFARSTEVTSINRAVMTLGFDRLKSWSNMLALGQLDDKPRALQEQAVTRACLARQLAEHWQGIDLETAFTIGLFSLLDAFVDIPIKVLCEKLKLAPEFYSALVEHQGPLGELLELIGKLEQANWSDVDWSKLEAHGLNSQEVSLAYFEALTDARTMINSI